MADTTTVVVGAGHCGLAMSRCLADRSIDHVVLERGEVANSWRTQRWDSLRLLTPNWMTRLPGFAYRGDDPDGYLTAPQVARLIADYAMESAAPVLANTTVTSIRPDGGGYLVQTDRGTWHAQTVVLAGGASAVADVPQPAGAAGACRDHHAQHGRLPQPRRAAGRRGAGGRRVGQRDSDRARAAPLRSAGHPRCRRARPDAADLPGPGHPVVDGRLGPARRALRRGSRPAAGAQPAVDAAGRHPGAGNARPERAAHARGAAGRQAGRDPGRRPRCSPGRCPTCAPWPT